MRARNVYCVPWPEKILSQYVLKWNRNGTVGVRLVTGLQVDRSRDRGSVPGGGENLFCLPRVFLKRLIAQKIQRDTQGYKIVSLTNLP